MRHNIAGILLLAMIMVTILNGLFPSSISMQLLWIAGLCGWLAAILLIADTSRILRWQLSLIIMVSAGLIGYASIQGAQVNITGIIGSNSALLTMIAAVGFLRLVALPVSQKNIDLPIGHKAYLQTLLGINLSSSVINISAPIIISDRIHAQRPLTPFTSQSITRIFCGVSSWSPFFAAMAVVLTYVDEARLPWIIVIGFPFTVFGFLLVYGEARLRYKNEIKQFVGYPMQPSTLYIPALLMVTVFSCVQWLPGIPILVAIALSALTITALTLYSREGFVAGLSELRQYVTKGLPRIVNELTLFLAAGALAVGMSALIQLDILSNPFSQFDVFTAITVLGMMLIAAAIGIHPVIPISSLTPLLMTLDPDPNLLAATYLFAWNLGTCASPLSGTHLVFQGRYDIPSWKAAFWNWPYVLVMYLIAAIWLNIVSMFLP